MKVPDVIFNDCYNYLKIVFSGCIFLYIYNALTAVFNALGDSKSPLKFLITSTSLNIILDIIFVKFFNFGTNGVAIATLITQISAAVGLTIYFIINIPKIKLKKPDKLFSFTIAKEMLFIAVPSIFQQLIVALGIIAVNGFVNSYGKVFIAGFTSATKIDAIVIMPMITISLALSTFTAQNLGAKKYDRIKQGFSITLKLAMIFAVLTSILLFFFGKYGIGLFVSLDNHKVIDYGTEYFKIVSIFYIIIAVMFSSNGTLRGLGKMKIFMISSALNIILRTIFAYALKPYLGYMAILWAIPFGWFISAVFSFTYLHKAKIFNFDKK